MKNAYNPTIVTSRLEKEQRRPLDARPCMNAAPRIILRLAYSTLPITIKPCVIDGVLDHRSACVAGSISFR
jgi:hypothetical protein